jgi:hypothetical protein
MHVDSWVKAMNTIKHPKQIITIQKKKKEKKKAPTTVIAPQPCKAESNKRKQQGPNQRENTNKLKCTPGPQRTNPGQANITNNPQTKEPTKTTEPMNNIYASPMITKLHPKHGTRNIQGTCDYK